MWEETLEELLVNEKKIYAKFLELRTITQELAQAVDRGDQTSVRMLLADRQTPLMELQELRGVARLKRCDLSGADEKRFDRLYTQELAQTPAERRVLEQRAANRRVLEQIVELDQRVNGALCKDKSVYLTHRA